MKVSVQDNIIDLKWKSVYSTSMITGQNQNHFLQIIRFFPPCICFSLCRFELCWSDIKDIFILSFFKSL